MISTGLHRHNISIHALLAESDMQGFCLWRRYYISIHALLAESDNLCFVSACWWRDFYPRSPCGERLTNDEIFAVDCRFLSLLLRRATERLENRIICRSYLHFYPRSPCGERPYQAIPYYLSRQFAFLSTLSLRRATVSGKNCTMKSIYPRLAESDYHIQQRQLVHQNFHPLSLRRATRESQTPTPTKKFLSTLSLRRATR